MHDHASVSTIGEFALIDRLRGILGTSSAIVGIGDDAAVLDLAGPEYLLASVDMLVDGVHFRLAEIEPRNLGRRAIACNASDIGAMGGRPTFALVSLALPPSLGLHTVTLLYEGMKDVAARIGVSMV